MNLNLPIPLRPTGIVRAVVWSPSKGIVRDVTFHNIVLNVGWDNLKSRWNTNMTPRYLYLGTGTTEPRVTDTGLAAISQTLAGKLNTSSALYANKNGYDAARMEFNYGEGEAQGTWTELGLAYGTTYTEPYNRALFRGVDGQPISLTVLSNEYLRVFVELRMYFPTSQAGGTFAFNGVSRPWAVAINNGAVDNPFGSSASTFFTEGMPRFWSYRTTTPSTNVNTAGLSSTQNGVTLTMTMNQLLINPGDTRVIESFRLHTALLSGSPFFPSWKVSINFPAHGAFAEGLRKEFDERITGGPIIVQWFRGQATLESGTATSGTSTTLSQTSKNWSVNRWGELNLVIVGGTGVGQSRRILSNTATQITIDGTWDVTPDATSQYEIRTDGE
jgi:hypothetical protein